jgi:hypothetical protein
LKVDPPTVVKYGAPDFPTVNSPGPGARGANFFAGGPDHATGDMEQTMDVSSLATDIDEGRIQFTLSGFFGGFADNEDSAKVAISFRNAGGNYFTNEKIGDVNASDRSNVTGLLFRTITGTVPADTRSLGIFLTFTRSTGAYNDGYVDNLTLKLRSTLGAKGRIAGVVRNDRNGDGKRQSGEGSLSGVTVFLDGNSNGKRNSGEKATVTDSFGAYQFTDLAPGAYSVVTLPLDPYRVSSTNPKKVSVAAGLTSVNDTFLSQTVVITGTVFNDVNRNGTKGSSEFGVGMVTVYLDFNQNGEPDDYELTDSTASSGSYKFVVPFGHYVIRVANLEDFRTAKPDPFFAVDLKKSQVVKKLDFALVQL